MTSKRQKKSLRDNIQGTGIIGDPIQHTLSPAMHNAAFKNLHLPFIYLPFHIKPPELGSFIKQARHSKLKGFNVTLPHKEAVIPYLDQISPEAKSIGAVNTVVFSKGKLKGYNTDGEGYLRSLWKEKKFRPHNKNIVILGAGGAARAVLYALGKKGSKNIVLVNRTVTRAKKLAKEFQEILGTKNITVLGFHSKTLGAAFSQTDLLVNTTSVGLDRTRFKNLPLTFLPSSAIVSDLVYRPLQTPLLIQAKRLKLSTHTGIGMLLHQGALAFQLWTKRKPPIVLMKKALLDALD